MTEASLRIKVDATDAEKAAKSLDQLAKSGAEAEGSGKKLEQQQDRLSTAAKTAAAAFAALAGSMVVKQIIDYADRWSDLNSKLVNATGSQQAADKAMMAISQTARTTYSSLEATANAFLRNSMTLTELGYSMEKQIQLSDALNNSLVISGTKGQQAESVMNALSKAFANGSLRGENFNTVIQSGGRTVQALADGLGVGTVELRAMAEAGRLTSDVVITALISQMEKLRVEAEKMPATVGDGMTLLKNATFEYVGRLDQATGASGALAKVLVGLADNFQHVAAAVGIISTATASKYVVAMGAAAIETALLTSKEVARTTALVAATGAEAARTAALVAGNSAMFTSTTALATAKAAQLAHTQAIAANTAATTAATAASSAWKASLIGLFGPGAIVAVAGGLMYALVASQKASAEEAVKTAQRYDELASSIYNMSIRELGRALAVEGEHLQALKNKQTALQRANDATGKYGEELRVLGIEVKVAEQQQGAMVRQLERLKDGFKPVTDETRAMAAATKESTEKFAEQIARLTDQRKQLGMTERELFIYGEAQKAIANGSSPAMVAAIEISAAALYDEEQQIKDTKREVDALAKAQEQAEKDASAYARAQEDAARAIEGQRKAVGDQIASLITQQHELGMTERELFIYHERVKAIANGALPETVDVIDELSASLWDNREAAKSAGEAAEEAARRQKAAAEAQAKALQDVSNMMRNDISSAFADMMMSGENAFDAIAKSFERMIYKMIADWAASGIMNFIGGLFGKEGLGGTSTLGTLFSGIGKKGTETAVEGGTGIMASIGGGLKAAGSAASGLGTAALGGLKAVGSGAMSALSAIPGWGWALGGLALASKLLDDSGTFSSNAGFLLKDLPSVSADRKFDVAPFPSGFDPVGFARREDQGNAIQIIDAFRSVDGALAAIYEAFGSPLIPAVHQGIRAYDEKGQGYGVFMGMAAEDGKQSSLPLADQLAHYAAEIVRLTYQTGYFGQDTFNKISTSGSHEDIIASLANALLGAQLDGSHSRGLQYVPFDGYRAELHKGERVLTASENRTMGNDFSSISRELSGLRAIMIEAAAASKRTADILLRVTRDGQSLVTVAA
jgi:tape measure domain-containing protein